jgi:hypothetical protein
MEQSLKNFCSICSKEAELKCSNCKQCYYCSRNCQKVDWKTHKIFCRESELLTKRELEADKLELKVRVDDSAIHGKGIFCTKPIKCGEKICYFDGYFQDARVKVSVSKSNEGVVKIRNAKEVFEAICDSRKTVNFCIAHPDRRKQVVNIGHDKIRAPFGLGQFINDAAQPIMEELNFNKALQVLKSYRKISINSSNCELDSEFWFVATKNINPGDELLIHYGIDFWLQKFMLEADDPLQRLLYYSLQDQDVRVFDLRKFFDYDNETCRVFLKYLTQFTPATCEAAEADPKKFLCQVTERVGIGES